MSLSHNLYLDSITFTFTSDVNAKVVSSFPKRKIFTYQYFYFRTHTLTNNLKFLLQYSPVLKGWGVVIAGVSFWNLSKYTKRWRGVFKSNPYKKQTWWSEWVVKMEILEILLALNIVHYKDNEIPRLNNQFIISNTQNSGLEYINNCLPHAKLSFLDSIIFTFEMRTM